MLFKLINEIKINYLIINVEVFYSLLSILISIYSKKNSFTIIQ